MRYTLCVTNIRFFIKKTIYLLKLKKNNKYKLQEVLQRLFVPYRFLDK